MPRCSKLTYIYLQLCSSAASFCCPKKEKKNFDKQKRWTSFGNLKISALITKQPGRRSHRGAAAAPAAALVLAWLIELINLVANEVAATGAAAEMLNCRLAFANAIREACSAFANARRFLWPDKKSHKTQNAKCFLRMVKAASYRRPFNQQVNCP